MGRIKTNMFLSCPSYPSLYPVYFHESGSSAAGLALARADWLIGNYALESAEPDSLRPYKARV
jgi:hypothetical protein